MENNGILIINKDLGHTSRDVVNLVCKRLNSKKVGHTGTLDPNASGVMVICVGKALKMCERLTNHDKEYVVGVTLGITSDTLDMDSEITKEEEVKVSREEIMKVVNSFKGTYMQEVPKYSAVKVNGRKLYEYARSNKEVILPKKEVIINSIQIIDDIRYDDRKVYFTMKCDVSKGTYIRSLVRDIGYKLNVPSLMNSLVRTRLGNSYINEAYSIEDIKNNNFKLISIQDYFRNIKKIIVDDEIAFKVSNGVSINNLFNEKEAFIFNKDNKLLALYKNENNICKPDKMFV